MSERAQLLSVCFKGFAVGFRQAFADPIGTLFDFLRATENPHLYVVPRGSQFVDTASSELADTAQSLKDFFEEEAPGLERMERGIEEARGRPGTVPDPNKLS